MTEFIFLTSGPIEYQLPGLNLYKSIRQTSLGLVYPGLKKDSGREIEKKMKQLSFKGKKPLILCATSKQTKETARVLANFFQTNFLIDQKLEAINFDFQQIMGSFEFKQLGVGAFDVARPRFLRAFFKDKLLESKLSVRRRIDLFLKENRFKKKLILAISHSFLLMIIRAYFLGGEEIFKNYSLLEEICQPGKRPFGFLEGFKVEIDAKLKASLLTMIK